MSEIRKVMITGGGGMVGRNLLEHPGLQACELLAPRHAELDLRDGEAVRDYLATHRPDLVIHAAGRVGGIQANMAEPVAFLLDNLDMGRQLVSAAQACGVTRLLNLGSSCMYPRGHDEPLREEQVLQGELEPTNEGYALAKVVTQRLCQYLMRQHPGLQYKTLVPCNLYGRHDKFDPRHSHLIPAIIHKLAEAMRLGQDTVEIWGTGEARREFMYAEDLADCVARCITHFDTLPELMNVGLGHDHTINEYYQAAAEVMGFEGRFTHDLSRPVGMARKLVSIERQQAWGWQARHSLREGLAKTLAFYRTQALAPAQATPH